MANQLIVAFVALVVLTRQSFASEYLEETANNYDRDNDQTGTQDYGTANQQLYTQDQNEAQHQYTTTGQNPGETYYSGPILDSGLSHGQSYNHEQGEAGTDDQYSIYGQDNVQNQNTGIGKHEGGPYDLDKTQNPGSSYGHYDAGSQDYGTTYEQLYKQENSDKQNQDSTTGKDEKDSDRVHSTGNSYSSDGQSNSQKHDQAGGAQDNETANKESNKQDKSDERHKNTIKGQNKKETYIIVLAEDSDSSSGYDRNKDQDGAEDRDNSGSEKHTEDQDNDANVLKTLDGGISRQAAQVLTTFETDKINVVGTEEDSVVLSSDGKNVTIGFSSIKFAQAILDNVTLAQYADVETSNGVLHQVVYLLENCDPKGFHHVISPK